jgi:hypothetical protein
MSTNPAVEQVHAAGLHLAKSSLIIPDFAWRSADPLRIFAALFGFVWLKEVRPLVSLRDDVLIKQVAHCLCAVAGCTDKARTASFQRPDGADADTGLFASRGHFRLRHAHIHSAAHWLVPSADEALGTEVSAMTAGQLESIGQLLDVSGSAQCLSASACLHLAAGIALM